MTILIAIITAILVVLSIILLYQSNRLSAALATAAMALLVMPHTLTAQMHLEPATLLFWLLAALLTIALQYMLPKAVAESTLGVGYIATGSLAGAMVGAILSPIGLIIGAAAGAILAFIAFCRTKAGRQLKPSSGRTLNYFCAKAFPAIITSCICVIAIVQLSHLFI